MPEVFPGYLAGYLPKEALPDSAALLPPPPAPLSAALAADQEANRKALALRGTPRFALATSDADLLFPHAAGTFSCALNAPVTQEDTPHLYVLLRRVLGDAAGSTGRAKNAYKRMRPFLVNKEPSCTPGEEAELGKQGSYPSGHSAAGWAWALVLTELAPDREDAILARGRAFGESRVVCNVHWQSDVARAASWAPPRSPASTPTPPSRRTSRPRRRRSPPCARGGSRRRATAGPRRPRSRPRFLRLRLPSPSPPRRFPWRSVRRS